MNFQAVLQLHLTAIQQRNLAAFLPTLTQGATFHCILPNGKHIATVGDFIDFTQGWFADPDWQIAFSLLSIVETEQMGIALLAVHYDDKDPTGAPYAMDYYLSLGFVQEAGEWRLVFDQNTLRKS